MFQNVSIVIVNSSHEAIDNITSVLEKKILSRQRPYIACLSCHALHIDESFLVDFINEKLTECRLALERVKQTSEFNQLEAWRTEVKEMAAASRSMNKRRSTSSRISKESKRRNQFSKRERDGLQRIIIDFPIERAIELYVILLGINDCDTIKSIASFELVPLLLVVNLLPRYSVVSERPALKLQEEALKNVALINLDVPVESCGVLNIRSQLIYDQFCHFLYDCEELKSMYRAFSKRLIVHDVNVTANENDLRQLRERLDETPHCMLSVERIYQIILEQIERNESETMEDDDVLPTFMDVKAFGKRFYDANDEWVRGFSQNPKLYASEIRKLEKVYGVLLDGVERVTLERRQILNYFMNKIDAPHEHIEFHFYVLKFLNWQEPNEAVKDFVTLRSIGHKKVNRNRVQGVTSDVHVDYRNLSKIPDEIEQLASERLNKHKVYSRGENFYAHLFTPSAMLQHLHKLTRVYGETFYRQYFKLFDVLLLKFPPRTEPPKFSLECHKKVVPTPLCFRDFIDYTTPLDSLRVVTAERKEEMHKDGSECNNKMTEPRYKPENFILAASIKSQRLKNVHDGDDTSEQRSSSSSDRQVKMESNLEYSTLEANDSEIHVYNACDKRVEYHVEESAFYSYLLSTRASIFSSLHDSQRHLNFSCALHDTKHLSCSYDMSASKSGCRCNRVTLSDDNGGVICSIDKSSDNPRQNMTLSYPCGMLIEISDDGEWIEVNEREIKRTYLSDGFVIIENGSAVQILTSNGTIYEICASEEQQVEQRECNQELTKRHQFAIAAASVFKRFVSFKSFVFTLASGQRYMVEGDSIVEELSPLHVREWSERGSAYLKRSDGLRLMKTDAFMRCQHPDGTIITTTYNGMDILVDGDDNDAVRRPLALLDELWKSEAENQSKFVIDDVLNCVSSDYFLNINQTCRFEREKCGYFQFDVSGIEIKLLNGATLRQRSGDKCEFVFNNGVAMRMSDSGLTFWDERCEECFRNNKVQMNFVGNEASDVLVSATDIEGNIFEIKASGRQRFYENNKCRRVKECERCVRVQREHRERHFGERWIVLNHDMSGYEITGVNPRDDDVDDEKSVSMETKSTMLLCRDGKSSVIDEDFDIDFSTSDDNHEALTKSTSDISPPSSAVISRKESGGELKTSEEVDKPQLSPWVTVDGSITADITGCRREMIKFYVNPLDVIPESVGVVAILKLQNSALKRVIDAVRRVRTYATEKTIVNVNALTSCPVGKRTFAENFRDVVTKSIEGYVEEKLEHFRESTARAIVEDLLQSASVRLFERSDSREIDKCHLDKASDVSRDEFANKQAACAAAAAGAHPIAIKSFSFV